MSNILIAGIDYNTNHPLNKQSLEALEKYKLTEVRDNVIYWKNSNEIPNKQLLEFWLHMGINNFSFKKCCDEASMRNRTIIDNIATGEFVY